MVLPDGEEIHAHYVLKGFIWPKLFKPVSQTLSCVRSVVQKHPCSRACLLAYHWQLLLQAPDPKHVGTIDPDLRSVSKVLVRLDV